MTSSAWPGRITARRCSVFCVVGVTRCVACGVAAAAAAELHRRAQQPRRDVRRHLLHRDLHAHRRGGAVPTVPNGTDAVVGVVDRPRQHHERRDAGRLPERRRTSTCWSGRSIRSRTRWSMDALDHRGPAQPARIDPAVCSELYQPGVDPANAQNLIQVFLGLPGLAAVTTPGREPGRSTGGAARTGAALLCVCGRLLRLGRVSDAIFEDPRLAEVYDPLDPDRSDLDVYAAMVDEFGAQRVLDIGCGTGTFALLLADRGIDVVGLDPAARSLDVARRQARRRPRAVDPRQTARDLPQLTRRPGDDDGERRAGDRRSRRLGRDARRVRGRRSAGWPAGLRDPHPCAARVGAVDARAHPRRRRHPRHRAGRVVGRPVGASSCRW